MEEKEGRMRRITIPLILAILVVAIPASAQDGDAILGLWATDPEGGGGEAHVEVYKEDGKYYENHSLASNPDACDGRWSELIDFYMPGINWEGYEDVKMTGWHRKLHIHQAPFYYIEYGLASLGAFQIWENAQKDRGKALQDYRQSLALGGTATLPELYNAAGANLSFDSDTLGSAVQLIEKTMAELEAQLA